jgi:hypothetical protein
VDGSGVGSEGRGYSTLAGPAKPDLLGHVTP